MYSSIQNCWFHCRTRSILLLACLLAVLTVGICSSVVAAESVADSETAPPATNSQAERLANQWGIEITALRLTAEGRMIDFRYRVLNAKKAEPLFIRQIKPHLLHLDSGKVLAVPNTAKVGTLRNSNKPKENRIYWMFFGNNGTVKQGDKVSIIIGDFKAEELVVL